MSQEHSKSTTIDGLSFEMRMLDPWIANEILHALSKVVGPSIGDVVAAASAGGVSRESLEKLKTDSKSLLDSKLDGKMIGSAISGLFMRMNASQSRMIIEYLSDKTTHDGKHLNGMFAAVFSGKIGTMYKFATWGLGVQFENFFGSISSAISWFVQKAEMVTEK